MQTLGQEVEVDEHDGERSESRVLRGLDADQAMAYAKEVRTLRQRVAALEAELAAARAGVMAHPHREAPPLTTIDFAPRYAAATASEFREPVAPAVVAVSPAPFVRSSDAQTDIAAADSSPASNGDTQATDLGFAEAWGASNAESSFEERLAERAFFQASTVDEESRTWLLTH